MQNFRKLAETVWQCGVDEPSMQSRVAALEASGAKKASNILKAEGELNENSPTKRRFGDTGTRVPSGGGGAWKAGQKIPPQGYAASELGLGGPAFDRQKGNNNGSTGGATVANQPPSIHQSVQSAYDFLFSPADESAHPSIHTN